MSEHKELDKSDESDMMLSLTSTSPIFVETIPKFPKVVISMDGLLYHFPFEKMMMDTRAGQTAMHPKAIATDLQGDRENIMLWWTYISWMVCNIQRMQG